MPRVVLWRGLVLRWGWQHEPCIRQMPSVESLVHRQNGVPSGGCSSNPPPTQPCPRSLGPRSQPTQPANAATSRNHPTQPRKVVAWALHIPISHHYLHPVYCP